MEHLLNMILKQFLENNVLVYLKNFLTGVHLTIIIYSDFNNIFSFVTGLSTTKLDYF